MKIGVIGLGTVGYPLFKALEYYHDDVVGYDKKNEQDGWDYILKTDMVFVCLPTNQGSDGRLDMSIVDSVLQRLAADDYRGTAVIKSTCGLGYIRKAINENPFTIVVFPEWLYVHNAFPGTLRPEMSVVGADYSAIAKQVVDVCVWHQAGVWDFVSPEEAVIIKLIANGYATANVSFANQIQLICEEYNIDAEKVMTVLRKDPRCSNPRYLKPGWAYGGYCLPKDTAELEHCVSDSILFKAIQDVNAIMIKKGATKELEVVKISRE